MASTRPLRAVITLLMDLLVVVAVALVLRLVIEFFGNIYAQEWGKTVVRLTDVLVVPLGIEPYNTPYGGIFNVNAVVSVILLLAAEWVLGLVRTQA